MKSSPKNNHPAPPPFVMWNPIPQGGEQGWQRQWFGHELDPAAVFNLRGIGIREPMFNADVHRPLGTGDWLIMLFHAPARLKPHCAAPSVPANTLMLWPPGEPQFYSWGKQFRDAFDSTIRAYVIRKRMSVAQRMLYDVNLRIGEIAEAVGYSDIYQFSKQFKKSFGVSPTKYREAQR